MDIIHLQESSKDPNFFDQDYRASSIGIGFVWFFLTIFPAIFKASARQGRTCYDAGWNNYDWYYYGWCETWNTKGTTHAWNVMTTANGIFFGFTTTFWLLSYIHKRIMQKIYFRVIAWFIPASWIFAFWSLIAFIIGGVQHGG